jgi:hypothetical protein
MLLRRHAVAAEARPLLLGCDGVLVGRDHAWFWQREVHLSRIVQFLVFISEQRTKNTSNMPPRLVDPFAGPRGAREYIRWWGNALYIDWCTHAHVQPMAYGQWVKRTLKEGKDWWVQED